MGLTRKTMSLFSMGAVDWRSDQERAAAYTRGTRRQARKQTKILKRIAKGKYMARLKTYGSLYQLPSTWPIYPEDAPHCANCGSDSTLDRQLSRLTGRPKKRKVCNGSLPEVMGATAGGRMRHRKAIWAVAVLASLGVVSGCGSSTPTTPPAVITQTVTVTPAPPEPSPSATPVATPAEPSTSSALEVFTMPNLVGENLQLAQDKLQALGSYLMDQQDAAGLGRIQVLDTNWRVCTQKPAPG